MARDENRAIEIVVRADIVSSVQQIEHDIGKIQEKVNRTLNVTASIRKIQIDKTAVNYVKNEDPGFYICLLAGNFAAILS